MNSISQAAAILGSVGGSSGIGKSKARSSEVSRNAVMKRWKNSPTVEERFWSNVDQKSSDECWPWKLAPTSGGYGRMKIRGKMISSHRLSWSIAYGPIPEGRYICHRCDNKICCNPHHLYCGTPKSNAEDARIRGRLVAPCGERNGMHKLTNAQALEIRRMNPMSKDFEEIGKRYGVSRGTIENIVYKSHWKSIGD